MKSIRLVVLGSILLVLAVGGCSSRTVTRPEGTLGAATDPAPQDTVPIIPPPPPPPVIQPAVFLSYADSTAAGETANTRWLLGNDSDQPFTMRYSVTSDAGWPGFPVRGEVALDALSTKVVVVAAGVPAGTAPGIYGLVITVDRPGNLTYTTEGVIRVHP